MRRRILNVSDWIGDVKASKSLKVISRAKLLVKGCVKMRSRAEGSYDARLGFPFLIILLPSVNNSNDSGLLY